MTITQEFPVRTIRAQIDQSAISRVSSFFSAGLEDILNELLQNSRRSNATQVTIRHEDGVFTITDDGDGIGDPQAILSFGRSDWDSTTVSSEHPAGMGLYALARRNSVNVASMAIGRQPWQVELRPEHFAGEGEASVYDSDPGQFAAGHGTVVSFPWDKFNDNLIQEATRYYPLPVHFNGEELPRKDFLEDALSIFEWQGLRIGIFNAIGGYTPANVNFHGVHVKGRQATASLSLVHQVGHYYARVDVVDCPSLELTLPARRELVETPFIEELRETTLKGIYQLLADTQDCPGVAKQTQEHAHSLGIEIPDALPALRTWAPDQDSDPCERAIRKPVTLTDEDYILEWPMERHEENALAHALDLSHSKMRLMESNDEELKGYDWYDLLPRISKVTFHATYGDTRFKLPKPIDDLPSQRPDAITVMLERSQNGLPLPELTLPTDLALQDHDDSHYDYLKPLVTADSTMRPFVLEQILMDSYFRYSDDSEADSYDTQEQYAQESSKWVADNLLLSKERALLNSVASAVQYTGILNLTPGTRIVITIIDNLRIDVTAQYPDNSESDAT